MRGMRRSTRFLALAAEILYCAYGIAISFIADWRLGVLATAGGAFLLLYDLKLFYEAG